MKNGQRTKKVHHGGPGDDRSFSPKRFSSAPCSVLYPRNLGSASNNRDCYRMHRRFLSHLEKSGKVVNARGYIC